MMSPLVSRRSCPFTLKSTTSIPRPFNYFFFYHLLRVLSKGRSIGLKKCRLRVENRYSWLKKWGNLSGKLGAVSANLVEEERWNMTRVGTPIEEAHRKSVGATVADIAAFLQE